ncbi:MAG: outer membrane beta-barrel protein [Myxococcota bacterium]
MQLIVSTILVFALGVAPCLFPPGARAAGRVKISGGLDLRETYQTNVFLERHGMADDFFSTISPALNLSYRGDRLNFDAESGATFFLYGRNSDLNDQFYNQRSLLEYKLGPRLSIEAENLYTYVRETIGQPEDLANNLVQSNSWLVGPAYRADLGSRSRGEFKATYGQTTYFSEASSGGELPDFGDVRGSVYVDRDLTERILVYTSQEFSRRDFKDHAGLNFTGLLSQWGFRWRLGRRLSVDVSGGYNWLNFDRLGNESGSIVDAALHYTPSLRTGITAGYSQLFTTDVFGNVFRQNRASLGMDRQITARTLLRLTSFISLFDQSGTASPDNNYYGGDFRVEHKLRRHLSVESSVGWRQNAGDLKTDDFEDLQTSIGLRYEF